MEREVELSQIPSEDDEISLIDIIRFFGRNWRFIGVITFGFAAIALLYSFSRPQSYQKQVTLLVEPNSLTVGSVALPGVAVAEIGALAVESVQNQTFEAVTPQATYDTTTQAIAVTFDAPSASNLDEVMPQVLSQLELDLQEPLERTLEKSLVATDISLERQEKLLESMEAQIAQIPPTEEARLIGLENQRASLATTRAALEIDREYLEQSLQDLEELREEVLPIAVVSESEVQQVARSPIQITILSLIAGFMVAVLAAIIREQIPRIKAELEEQKPDKLTK
ncbi:MAG: Wzz/FepE/Etk N-terminal domain-containing protein [Spirulinaceae cyanobacterium]